MLQNELNSDSDVARYITHIKPVLQQFRLLTGLNESGKTPNIAIQLVLQQCCKTSCTFLLPVLPKLKTWSLYLHVAPLVEGGHFATDDCFSQKSRGPSIRRAAHLHISHETSSQRISRECPEDFFKTWKFFWQKIFQSEGDSSTCKIYTYIKRKSRFL